MSVVFIQKDEEFEMSFIWAEDINKLKNLLSAYHEDVLSFRDKTLGYYTKDFESISSICNVVFDEVIVIETDEGYADDFVKSCKEILDGQ
jgi:hypothetical protein